MGRGKQNYNSNFDTSPNYHSRNSVNKYNSQLLLGDTAETPESINQWQATEQPPVNHYAGGTRNQSQQLVPHTHVSIKPALKQGRVKKGKSSKRNN